MVYLPENSCKWVYTHNTVQLRIIVGWVSFLNPNTVQLRIIVGWVEQSETQQMSRNVGSTFLKRHFTQVGKPAHMSGSPTYAICFLGLTQAYCLQPNLRKIKFLALTEPYWYIPKIFLVSFSINASKDAEKILSL